MVVPIPTALPWTAATTGTWFFASARSSRQTGNVRTVARKLGHEVAEVVSGGEVLALSAQRDEAEALVARRALERIGQRGVHGDGDRVAPLGPGEGDREDIAFALDLDVLAQSPLPCAGANRVTTRRAPAMRPQFHQSRD